jgi:hypothetical protein
VKLTSGAQFGPYVVVEFLGGGGMGDVYRVRDTRLPRDVALKILRGSAAEVPERVRRFQHEARAASSLNHPNIVVVYEAGEAPVSAGEPPIPYLAMELVEGEPLGYASGHREPSIRAVLDMVTQLADGLARAHESGIVHRDLKPSNILVTPDGIVKIVDFGLAKLQPSAGASDAHSSAITVSAGGGVLGTPAYMSPEQARGEDTTPASDQFSFGCVVYELLTGRRPFVGTSPMETMSAILRDDPIPISDIRPGVPAPLRWLVERCLCKEARDRYASTRDMARDLRMLREHLGELGVAGPPLDERKTKGRAAWKMAAAAGLLLAAGAALAVSVSTRLRIAPPPEFRRLTFQEGTVHRALFIPRSSAILHTASWNAGSPRTFTLLPESSGLARSLEADTQLPMAFSDDGSEVLVLLGAARPSLSARGVLAVWPAVGGKPRPIVEDGGWGDWAGGDRLMVFVRDLGAEHVLVRREAGQERILFRTAGWVSYVRISPDRTWVAFIHHPSRGNDAGEVRLLRMDGSEGARSLTPVFETCLGLDWNTRTHEIWFTATRAPHRGTMLLAVDASGRQRTVHMLPEPTVLESVSDDGRRCLLNVRDDRRILAVRQGRHPPTDLTWLGMSLAADVSPDGKMVLFWDGGGSEKSAGAWVRPLDGTDAVWLGGGEPQRFSSDGHSLVSVNRTEAGGARFDLIPVGAGTSRSVIPPDAESESPSFSGDDGLLFTRHVDGRNHIWKIQMDGTGARSLELTDCNKPVASPAGDLFLAICGAGRAAIEIQSTRRSEPRRLFDLPPGDAFLYARWNGVGDRVFAITSGRRMLTLDSSNGRLISEEHLPTLGKGEAAVLDGAGLSSDGSVQAYSANRISSRLYLAEDLR